MTAAYSIRTDKTYLNTQADLREQFRRWGVSEWHARREPNGGVVIEWFPKDSQELRTLSSYDQARPQDNLRKLYLIIEALRLNEVRGFESQMRAFYLQLPAPATMRDPYEVLGVRPDADLQDVDAIFRSKAKRLHPDQGGSAEAMKELNQAMERIRQEKEALA